MDSQIEAGRRWVLAIIVAIVSLELLVIFVFNISLGPGRLPQQIVRFFLTIGLCVFLYRGANWARWLTVILYALAGLGFLILWLRAPSAGMASLLFVAIGLAYLAATVVLVLVPTVRAYFRAVKTKSAQHV